MSPCPARSPSTRIVLTRTLNSHRMLRKTRSQNQPASSSTSPPASSSEIPRRPGKEKATELTEVEAAQMSNRQAQLEETVRVMSQEIGTIKQLLERPLVSRAPAITRGGTAVEERCIEQKDHHAWQSGLRASYKLSAGPPVAGRIYPFSHTKQQKDEH